MATPPTIIVQIHSRQDTEANWIAANPVPATGEICLTLAGAAPIKFKIGDGTSRWTDLKYYSAGGGKTRQPAVIASSDGQTSFTIPSGYTVTTVNGVATSDILVYFNGILLEPEDYTATNGTSVVLNSSAVKAGDGMTVFI